MRVYIEEVIEAVSSATRLTPLTPSGRRTTRRIERTSSSEAIAHRGTIATPGNSGYAATGTRPISVVPDFSCRAHSAGVDGKISYRSSNSLLRGSCSKSHIRGAGFTKLIAAMESFFETGLTSQCSNDHISLP